MRQYLNSLQYILDNGTVRNNRTGVDTLAVFGHQEKFDLTEGFPTVTTKRLAWKAVVSELLWFLEGSADERRLAEIRYGKPREELKDKRTIWTDNAANPKWDRGNYSGDLGRIYGVQWRNWRTIKKTNSFDPTLPDEKQSIEIDFVDQIQNIIDTLKNNPNDRRIILTAWNPGELDDMALPPCHLLYQFNVRTDTYRDKYLDCQMYQRSCDAFLGVPFNIASCALLTHILAQIVNLKPGNFIHTYGDLHIYTNHINQVKEQLTRKPFPLPTLKLTEGIKEIDKFTMGDIHLENYQAHDTIKAKMAV